MNAEQARKNVEESKNKDTTLEDIEHINRSISSSSKNSRRSYWAVLDERTNKKLVVEYFEKKGFKVEKRGWLESNRHLDISW